MIKELNAVGNFDRNISEIIKFKDYIFKLEAGLKLKEILKDFKKVSSYYDKNFLKLKGDSEEWTEFNKRINFFKNNGIKKADNYIKNNVFKVFDSEEIISRQLFVMIITVFEVYLDQKYRYLLMNNADVYFNNIISNDGGIKNIDIEVLNRCKFDIKQIGEELIKRKKINYSFQSVKCIEGEFNMFNIKLPHTKKAELDLYFDIRHCLVHNLGAVSENFKEKHDYGEDIINIGESIVCDLIKCIRSGVEYIEKESRKLDELKIKK